MTKITVIFWGVDLLSPTPAMHAQVTPRLDARYIEPAAAGHVRYYTIAWLGSPESSHRKSEDDTA